MQPGDGDGDGDGEGDGEGEGEEGRRASERAGRGQLLLSRSDYKVRARRLQP